jgi:hypothetical protein
VIRVEAGANGPTSRSARIGEADKLFVEGVVDDEYVLQRHRIRNYKEVFAGCTTSVRRVSLVRLAAARTNIPLDYP